MASSTDASKSGAVSPSALALPVAGVRLAAAASGQRYKNRDDLCLIEVAATGNTHCLFTTNRFSAAPVVVARRHLARAPARYLVINAGNANAGTGLQGEKAAVEICAAVARAAGCDTESVLPYSTGVIGQQLDAGRLAAQVPALMAGLRGDAWAEAAAAILTTDTRIKLRSARVRSGDHEFTVTGMTKGSGMIKPNMATMLAFVATDAAVELPALRELAAAAAARSFNAITVDGDTSTNDAFALIASGAAGNRPMADSGDANYVSLLEALDDVCAELAKDIIRDGEGATKFVSVAVRGGIAADDCAKVAYAVAESPLVKTALFASDPNWGRILAAVGRAGAQHLAIEEVDIDIGPCPIVRGGQPVPDYDEAAVARVMREVAIDIAIRIGRGSESLTVWTCDLSYDYVKINAEYRS
ncbi:MAG: bifunctional glutamate N-acetyltransferase/amino-acid acetyltransferase ArgJ [Gammaproteobacteria bacterium]